MWIQISSGKEPDDTTKSNKKYLWLQHNILIRWNPTRIYEGAEFKLK